MKVSWLHSSKGHQLGKYGSKVVFVPVHDLATQLSSLFQQNTSGSDERCLCHWFNIFVAIAPVFVRQNVNNQSLVGGENLSEPVALETIKEGMIRPSPNRWIGE